MTSRPMANAGAARIFLDRNGNGIFDPGDALLPDAALAIDHRRDPLTQDVDGLTVKTELDPYRPTNVSVAEDSLSDPYLKATGGVSLVPRPGHMETVDLPVVDTAELDGTLVLGDAETKRPLSGVKLRLIDAKGAAVAETVSAFDGYFYFSRLVPGHYRLIEDAGDRAAAFDFGAPAELDLAPGAIRSGLVVAAARRPAQAPP